MSFKSELKKTIKTRFISGLLVIVPLFITIAILKFAVQIIDNFIKPYILAILGQEFEFPFIGLIVTISLIILSGIFVTNVFGQKFLKIWEKILFKIPIINVLYSSSKKLIEGVAVPGKKTFQKVVMVEWPRKGMYALGFLANKIKVHLPTGEKEFWSVFIASTPTPISGFVVLVPEDEAIVLDLSIEDGIKYFVSGSVASDNIMTAAGYGPGTTHAGSVPG